MSINIFKLAIFQFFVQYINIIKYKWCRSQQDSSLDRRSRKPVCLTTWPPSSPRPKWAECLAGGHQHSNRSEFRLAFMHRKQVTTGECILSSRDFSINATQRQRERFHFRLRATVFKVKVLRPVNEVKLFNTCF